MQEIIHTSKGNISVSIYGTGTPVVLLHGFGEDSRIWEQQVDHLKHKYLLIVPDLPGSGNSRFHQKAIDRPDGRCDQTNAGYFIDQLLPFYWDIPWVAISFICRKTSGSNYWLRIDSFNFFLPTQKRKRSPEKVSTSLKIIPQQNLSKPPYRICLSSIQRKPTPTNKRTYSARRKFFLQRRWLVITKQWLNGPIVQKY